MKALGGDPGGQRQPVIVVCGPTASGKSVVADRIAEALSATTIVVDSMQVYREIPHISNQARGRPAELVGVISVTEEWTVARHRDAADTLFSESDSRFVLDAGSGMYLNAILMDIELAPRVAPSIRAEATTQASRVEDSGVNPMDSNRRREVRQRELDLVGAPARGSIWTSKMRIGAEILYLRPPRDGTDAAIEARTDAIVGDGIREARLLMDLAADCRAPTSQVMGSIGVRELVAVIEAGEMGVVGALGDAEREISTRTRRLSRRQVRWFDKLVRTLEPSANITVTEGPDDPLTHAFIEKVIHQYPHDRIG